MPGLSIYNGLSAQRGLMGEKPGHWERSDLCISGGKNHSPNSPNTHRTAIEIKMPNCTVQSCQYLFITVVPLLLYCYHGDPIRFRHSISCYVFISLGEKEEVEYRFFLHNKEHSCYKALFREKEYNDMFTNK